VKGQLYHPRAVSTPPSEAFIMLQAIHSKANSLVVKLLMGLLMATFALWGIGDIFRNWSADTSVAKVGGKEISADQLSSAMRDQLARLRNILGNDADIDDATKRGVAENALNGLIDSDLVDLEVQRLGLAMGDGAVRQAILDNPAFRDPSGLFDRNRYQQLLALNQLSEPQFEASVRQDLLRGALTGAVVDGATPPIFMANALYRSRAEQRTAMIVTLTPASVPAPPMPTESQLAAFHDAHKDDFRLPERRSLTLALLRVGDVAATIKIPEAKLKDAYEQHRNEFNTPEERDLKQLLLPDEAKAKAAETALKAGKDFATVAKEAGPDASSADLGWVKRDDLPTDLAKAAFTLPQGKTSAPIKSSFGWHILLVSAIKPATVQPFAAVKDRLQQSMARDQAADAISDIANHVDDAVAAGDSLATIAQKYALKTETIAKVDAQGRGPDGKPVDLPQPSDAILHAAFATPAGQSSPLTELGEEGYFIVHVDTITPAEVQPLAAAHAKAVTLWQDQARKDALKKLAQELVQEVKAGKSLDQAAAARKLTATTTPALQRTSGDDKVPPALVASIFDAKKGEAVSAPAGDNYAVAQVETIEPADPSKNADAVKDLSDQITGEMRNDLMSAFEQALRAHFPVEINQTNFDRVL
jgi:peptidyl-prolyl cis-trans isomerase D